MDEAAVSVEVLAVLRREALGVLHRLQVSTGSALGALALNCGGLLVDDGWLRILGGGGDGLPDLATENGLTDPSHTRRAPEALVVAYDVLGGRFAIDGGGLGIATGDVCYWGADTLSWLGLGFGHAAFVSWALSGRLDDFYADVRWPNWQSETRALRSDQGLAVYPPPFAAESRPMEATSRRAVPFSELVYFYDSVAAQL